MRLVWFTGIAAFVLLAGIAWYLAPLQPGILTLQFAFRPRAFGEIVHAWPPEHLLRFRAHLPFDYLLLVCYGAFGYSFASRAALFAGHSPRARAAVAWLLPVAAAFDAGENGLHGWLTEFPRLGVVLPYTVAASCAALKWALVVVFALAVVQALIRDGR